MLCIKNATVITMAEAGVIEHGDVLVDGGKIVAVGRNLHGSGEVLDATGLFVTPGFVDAHSHIGGIAMDGGMDEDLNELTDPVTAELDSYYGIDPASEGFKTALAAGITTSCVVPGSGNVVGGWGVVIKSAGDSLKSRVIRDPAVLKAAMGINPKGVYAGKSRSPTTRMAIAETLREYFRKVKEYMAKKEAAGEDESKLPPYDEAMEHGIPVLKKEIPLKVHSYMHDMMTVLAIADEFDFDVTLDHAQGATDFLEELAGNPHVRGVVYGPIAMGLFPGEGGKIDYDAPFRLDALGKPAAVMTDGPVTNAALLLNTVGEAVREGMDPLAALRLVTTNPARILGVEDRVGSIEPGKDADLAIFSAQPACDPRAAVVMTIVDGKVAYRR